LQERPIAPVPHVDRFRARPGDDHAAVRAPAQAEHLPQVAARVPQQLAVGSAEHAQRVVVRDRRQLIAVGAEGDAVDRAALVIGQRVERRARARVDDLRAGIPAQREAAAVGAERAFVELARSFEHELRRRLGTSASTCHTRAVRSSERSRSAANPG
jgi:hypothetical protein